MYRYNLEAELYESEEIAELVMDEIFAQSLYSGLCNVSWRKEDNSPEGLVSALSTVSDNSWHCSWRYAGRLVAELRNRRLPSSKQEDYLYWYCGGDEGHVSEEVKKALENISWKPLEVEISYFD